MKAEMVWMCSTMGRRCIYVSMGNPEGKRSQGKPRYRCVDNIKLDLREIEWGIRVLIGTSGGLL
jgi:hypothetical protein